MAIHSFGSSHPWVSGKDVDVMDLVSALVSRLPKNKYKVPVPRNPHGAER